MIATFLNQKTSYLTLSQFLIKSFSVPLRYYKFLCLLRATSPDLKCFPLTHLSSYFAPLSSFHTTFLLFFPTPIIFCFLCVFTAFINYFPLASFGGEQQTVHVCKKLAIVQLALPICRFCICRSKQSWIKKYYRRKFTM